MTGVDTKAVSWATARLCSHSQTIILGIWAVRMSIRTHYTGTNRV